MIRPELDQAFKDHGKLERKVQNCTQYRLNEMERHAISSEFPDTLSLTNLSHVLALIGQNARFSAVELQVINEKVTNGLAPIVKNFKDTADQILPFRQSALQGEPFDLEKVKGIVKELFEIFDKLEESSNGIRELIDEFRSTRPPMTSLKEKTFYDLQGAIWIVEPIRFYKSFLNLNASIETQLEVQAQSQKQKQTQTQTQKENEILNETLSQNNKEKEETNSENHQVNHQLKSITINMNTNNHVSKNNHISNNHVSANHTSNNNHSCNNHNSNNDQQHSPQDSSDEKSTKIQIPHYSKKRKNPQPHQQYKKNTIADFCQWCCERTADQHIDQPTKQAIFGLLHQTGAYNTETGLVNKTLLESKVKEYFKYFKGTLPQDCTLTS